MASLKWLKASYVIRFLEPVLKGSAKVHPIHTVFNWSQKALNCEPSKKDNHYLSSHCIKNKPVWGLYLFGNCCFQCLWSHVVLWLCAILLGRTMSTSMEKKYMSKNFLPTLKVIIIKKGTWYSYYHQNLHEWSLGSTVLEKSDRLVLTSFVLTPLRPNTFKCLQLLSLNKAGPKDFWEGLGTNWYWFGRNYYELVMG